MRWASHGAPSGSACAQSQEQPRAPLTQKELDDITGRLKHSDSASQSGPWTSAMLNAVRCDTRLGAPARPQSLLTRRALSTHPNMPSKALAELVSVDQKRLKINAFKVQPGLRSRG